MTYSRQDIARLLAAVIAEELEAQHGVRRAAEDLPGLVADAVLDHFEVSPRQGHDESHG